MRGHAPNFPMEAFVLHTFWRDEGAQDLIEYTLLLAAIALAGAAAYLGMGGSTNVIWTIINSRLASANAVSSS
jgi:Flp pilus assembly pilin Flp